MKIVKLESDRIKVILSESDLESMHINPQTLSPSSPELTLFLCEVMTAVKKETGFSLEQGQALVEATKSDDGIVLIISRTSEEGIRIQPAKKNDCAVFEFLSFDNLTGLIKNISPAYLVPMRLYSYSGKFYLAVPKRRIPILIYEYSFKNRKSPVAESVLLEYGQLLAGGYRLMKMASGLKKLN